MLASEKAIQKKSENVAIAATVSAPAVGFLGSHPSRATAIWQGIGSHESIDQGIGAHLAAAVPRHIYSIR